ncbi:glycine betaine/proline transport system substrate-binding protein [Devosia lucknowensis]|uniref:Glycine betaine/proline transport system substrate-binding protein n=1 Tax=Devosia lucknowensis TaxID=1096929 RepID=A0A1Y6GEJ7_9HYPH|nr:glycine betaine ABC transporter substrate-binding protein [Devosia lucknowensis]SMQ86250.1 glycine betaine/proline transport system substrate-binding protein [Devosia lucknowensis]
MKRLRQAIILVLLTALSQPSQAQITVLDSAQDDASQPSEAASPGQPPPPCGTRPLSIARMSWPSAALLAEIHARILAAEYNCEVRVVLGDLAATASSMGSTGQPQVAPEMWVNRIADLWNGAMEGQQVRSAAPTFTSDAFEGWYMPSSLAGSFVGTPTAAGLADALPQAGDGGPIQFISCPLDWACSVINRHLVEAYELSELVEIVEPSNRLEMDRMIAEAVNRREPFLFYYWQPNAVLAQLDFAAIDMGAYDETAAKCLADRICNDPKPSAFPADAVVIAVADRVFTETPIVAGYLQRSSLPLSEMNTLLAELNEPGATVESVADRFVSERKDLWQAWVSAAQ